MATTKPIGFNFRQTKSRPLERDYVNEGDDHQRQLQTTRNKENKKPLVTEQYVR